VSLKLRSSLMVFLVAAAMSYVLTFATTSSFSPQNIRIIYPAVWSLFASVVFYCIFNRVHNNLSAIVYGLIAGTVCGAIGLATNYVISDYLSGIPIRAPWSLISKLGNYGIASIIMMVPVTCSISYYIGFRLGRRFERT
jgi:hypothetical protein